MFIRSTSSLGFTLSSGPIRIPARPCNVPRVGLASTSLRMHFQTPPNMLFHSSTKKLQQSQDRGRGKDKDIPSPRSGTKTHPSPTDPKTQSDIKQEPTDSEMDEYIPGFSKLDTDEQLAKIESAKSHFAAQIGKDDPACNKQQRKAQAMMEILSAKEKEVRKGDWWAAAIWSFFLSLFF